MPGCLSGTTSGGKTLRFTSAEYSESAVAERVSVSEKSSQGRVPASKNSG